MNHPNSNTDPPIERLLSRLKSVESVGNRKWTARCPAHEDQRASLSITEAGDGTVLIKCHAGCASAAVVDSIGLTLRDLFRSDQRFAGAGKRPEKGGRKLNIVEVYEYRDENGVLLYQCCRLDPKDFRQRRPDGEGKWRWSMKGVRRVLYRLQELLAADHAEIVFVVEGEKDVETLRKHGLIATTNVGGAEKWLPEYSEFFCKRRAAILPDNDEAGEKHAKVVSDEVGPIAAMLKVVRLPGLPPKGDVSDWLASGGTVPELLRLVEAAPEWEPELEAVMIEDGADDSSKPRKSQADRLVEIASQSGFELFHTPGGDPEAYVTIQNGSHRETMRIRSKAFKTFLGRMFWNVERKVPAEQAMQDTINVLAGQAVFEGKEYPVSVRIAEHGDMIYLDLGDDEWRVVEITASGWRVIEEAPARFVRPRGLKALPVPEAGRINELREFVNVADDDDFALLVACLISYLRPKGPYPVLAVYGEQGSAKSTTTRIVRELIDPNQANLRCEPKCARDLAISAANGWVIVLENLSSIPVWLSDALCRLSTGGGFATRELFTDGEEKLFDAQRPVIVNGIVEMITRPDLADRAIAITLPAIAETRRVAESNFWPQFYAARPRILGALLDRVSAALRHYRDVSLESLPRMADFAIWATAAEAGMGEPSGAFVRIYSGNREGLNETALESCVFVPVLMTLLDQNGPTWEGTATALLHGLNERASDEMKRQQDWPKKGNALSGALRRIAPNLRKRGIDVSFGRTGHNRQIRIRVEEKNIVTAVTRPDDAEIIGDSDSATDRHQSESDRASASPADTTNPPNSTVSIRNDDGDDLFPNGSDEMDEWTA